MTNRKLHEHTNYIVVCKSKKQARDLFARARRYYQSAAKRHPLSVRDFSLEIAGPLDTIKFVSERQMYEDLHFLGRIKCTLVSATSVNKQLDKLEKEK